MQKPANYMQIRASLWRYWCSGAQQRDCMKTIAFGEEVGKDGAHQPQQGRGRAEYPPASTPERVLTGPRPSSQCFKINK